MGLLAAGPALAQQPALRLLPRVLPVPRRAPQSSCGGAAGCGGPGPDAAADVSGRAGGDGRRALRARAPGGCAGCAGAQEREAKAEEAAAALKEGQKAYDELDTQKALQQFDQAAQAYEASDLSRHFADMSRARVMKIASYVANGDNKAFVGELKEVLARNPHAEFSSNFFPPDELAIVEKARKASSPRPPGPSR